jgi:Fe2+ or Zn2+ uptake regulation protein
MRQVLEPLDSRTKKRRVEEFVQRCREQGVPLTNQRRIVLEAVLDLDCHPTADQVYASRAVRKSGISRATVYRSLESLVLLGLITKACHPGGVVRYDGRTEMHHHLICLHCDAVVDIADSRLDRLPIPDTSVFGFEIRDFRVQLRGLCPRCQEMEDQ